MKTKNEMNGILNLFDGDKKPSINLEVYIEPEFYKAIIALAAVNKPVLAEMEELLKKYKFQDLMGNELDIKVEQINGITLPQATKPSSSEE